MGGVVVHMSGFRDEFFGGSFVDEVRLIDKAGQISDAYIQFEFELYPISRSHVRFRWGEAPIMPRKIFLVAAPPSILRTCVRTHCLCKSPHCPWVAMSLLGFIGGSGPPLIKSVDGASFC